MLIPNTLLPDIHARVRERLVFNFAIPLDAARSMLPKEWLTPHEIRDGQALLSLCVLDMAEVTIKPWPSKAGMSGLHCAHRLAVIDRSEASPRPAVFVRERLTSSRVSAAITSLGCPGRHRHVEIHPSPPGDRRTLEIIDNGERVFAAEFDEAPQATPPSRLFDTRDDFERLLRAGATSYAPAVIPGILNRVDLEKGESHFEPLRVLGVSDSFVTELTGAPAIASFDGLLRTRDVRYTWSYRGRVA
ncbi:MAG TPA: hypothetical protein VFF73_17615 [Planctomycetota bacterium]|nr:hypothetical protein [Planctomycetota bacterium]